MSDNQEKRLAGEELLAALQEMSGQQEAEQQEPAVADEIEPEQQETAEMRQELADQDDSQFENYEQAQEAEEPSIEEQARKMGWKPQGEYNDTPEDFVSAEEFVARAPFIKQIHKLKDELRKQAEGMKSLAQTVQQAEERGKQKALAELQAQKEQAYRLGQVEQARALEKQQEELRGSKEQQTEEVAAPGGNVTDMIVNSELYQNYLTNSSWVNGTSAEDLSKQYTAQQAADFYINRIGADNFNHAHIGEMIKFVDSQVNPKRQPAPNPNRAKPPAVATTKSSKRSSSAPDSHPIHPDWNKLNDAGKLIVKQCFLNEKGQVQDKDGLAAYMNELKNNGTIK